MLKVLQDQAPSVELEKIKIVLESDFNCKVEEMFREIDSEAIAAASLAQVHRAVLKSGEEVAIKI